MSTPETVTRSPRRWLRPGIVVLGLGTAVVAVAGLAWATGFGPGLHRAGMARDLVEFRVHRALGQVDASAEQEEQVMARLDQLFAFHEQRSAVHHELHERAAAALTGTTVDRAALEAVRADAIRQLENGSRELVDGLADMAELLTPAQRQQLAELAREHFE